MTFNSNYIITQHFAKASLRTYFAGFDLKQYRYDELSDVFMDAIVDFAFGYHTGILKNYDRRKLREAAKSIYNIKGYKEAKEIYVDNDSSIDDSELQVQEKYLKRGEFGELILHVILRDFFNTIPLLSKIYFKDTDGATVHGFDLVHIGNDLKHPTKSSIYFGESKLYSRKNGKAGEHGITDLINDIKDHFNKDFLYREITLIGKKKHSFTPLDEYLDKNTEDDYLEFLENKSHWFQKLADVESGKSKLQDLLSSVTIPIICTYQSEIYNFHNDETTEDFISDYEKEMLELNNYFLEKLKNIEEKIGEPIKTDLNIVLILFPIPNKKELLSRLHNRLYNQQNA